MKVPKIESNKQIGQSPGAYPAAAKAEVTKAEKKEPSAQRSDPILAKIITAKEEDKRPTRSEISREGPLINAYLALWDSLRLINGSACR